MDNLPEGSLEEPLRQCLQKVRKTSQIARPVEDQIAEGKYDSDFLEKVKAFMTGFWDLQEVFENLPIENGNFAVRIPESEREQTELLLTELVEDVKKLNKTQETVIDGVKEFMGKNRESMKTLREARGIFDKFIKRPKQQPRFFDRKG